MKKGLGLLILAVGFVFSGNMSFAQEGYKIVPLPDTIVQKTPIDTAIYNNTAEFFTPYIINEINTYLHIEGLPKVTDLNVLPGYFVNLEYRLPNGQIVKFLDDNATYLGSQLECEFGGDRCFGIVANMDFLLVCTYEQDGANPELVVYKKR